MLIVKKNAQNVMETVVIAFSSGHIISTDTYTYNFIKPCRKIFNSSPILKLKIFFQLNQTKKYVRWGEDG